MSDTASDLHGNAPDHSPIVLLLIDVINDFEFESGEKLFEQALPAASSIAELVGRARAEGVPVVYANDNFGRWRSDFREVVDHVLDDGVRGEPIARLLRPEHEDYFVLKPKNSAFYATTLETLLEHLGAKRLILTGFAGDNCVLFTANDAYLRDYELVVPRDCVASVDPEHNRLALEFVERVLKGKTVESREVALRWDESEEEA